jgi:hypothetical protein
MSAAAAAPASAACHGVGGVGGGAAVQAENSSPEQTTIAIVTRPSFFCAVCQTAAHTPSAMSAAERGLKKYTTRTKIDSDTGRREGGTGSASADPPRGRVAVGDEEERGNKTKNKDGNERRGRVAQGRARSAETPEAAADPYRSTAAVP